MAKRSNDVIEPVRGIGRINLGHLSAAIGCILFLAVPFIFHGYVKAVGLFPPCVTDGCDQVANRLFVTSTWLALLSLAATAGCLGTILSFFLRQTRDEPINSETVRTGVVQTYIGLREITILCFFGSIFGLVMLSLFIGGFLQGNLFPNFLLNGDDSWTSINVRISGWAKTFVWTFLAGFSERLIPDLLDNLVRRAAPLPVKVEPDAGKPDNDKGGRQD